MFIVPDYGDKAELSAQKAVPTGTYFKSSFTENYLVPNNFLGLPYRPGRAWTTFKSSMEKSQGQR